MEAQQIVAHAFGCGDAGNTLVTWEQRIPELLGPAVVRTCSRMARNRGDIVRSVLVGEGQQGNAGSPDLLSWKAKFSDEALHRDGEEYREILKTREAK